MIKKKTTKKAAAAAADVRANAKAKPGKPSAAKSKALLAQPEETKRPGKRGVAGKNAPGKNAVSEIKEAAPAVEDDAGGEDRLRAHLRAAGLPASLIKPVAGAVAKLIDLAANNRSGFQSSLNYIAGQPSSALPAEAPEYFRNRPVDPETGKRETIVKFLERVWQKPWINERLLTRTALRRLDLPAATALNNFLHAPKERWEPKNELPDHIVVPTKSEVNDTLLEDADKVREARRIVDARWRRQRGLVRGKK